MSVTKSCAEAVAVTYTIDIIHQANQWFITIGDEYNFHSIPQIAFSYTIKETVT